MGLIDLVGQLRDDNALSSALLHFLYIGSCADIDTSTPGAIGFMDPPHTIDHGGGREIRARDDGHKVVDRCRGIIDQHQATINDLTKIMRRNIGG